MSNAGSIRFDDTNENENNPPVAPVRKVTRKKATSRATPAAPQPEAQPPAPQPTAAPTALPPPIDLQLALAHDAGDIAALAERCGLSIHQLAQRLISGDDAAWRATLAELLDAIAPIATRQGRLHAIRRLRQLADSDEHPETARKSCVDLAKLPSDILAAPSANNTDAATTLRPGSFNPEQERAVLVLLNKLGQLAAAREAGEEEGTRHQAPGTCGEEEKEDIR